MPSLAIITAVLSTNMAIFHVQPPPSRLPHPLLFLSFLPCELLDTQCQYATNIIQNKRIFSPQERDGPPLVFCLIFIINHKDLKTSGETTFCPKAITTPTPPTAPFLLYTVRVHVSERVCVCKCVCMPGCLCLFRSNPFPAVQLPSRLLPRSGKST